MMFLAAFMGCGDSRLIEYAEKKEYRPGSIGRADYPPDIFDPSGLTTGASAEGSMR